MMLLDHGWAGAVEPAPPALLEAQHDWTLRGPRPNQWGDLEVTVTGDPASVMDWVIYHHVGAGLIRRVAWSIMGVRDALDTLNMSQSGSGKGTLWDAIGIGLGSGTVARFMASTDHHHQKFRAVYRRGGLRYPRTADHHR